MTQPDLIVQSAQAASTHVFGRSLISSRGHHFIIDGTQEPKEEITPVEAFMGAVAACAVQQVERFARADGVSLSRVDAEIVATRAADTPQTFHHVDLRVVAVGASQKQAESLVAQFQGHCPLYGTLAAATEIRVTVETRSQ